MKQGKCNHCQLNDHKERFAPSQGFVVELEKDSSKDTPDGSPSWTVFYKDPDSQRRHEIARMWPLEEKCHCEKLPDVPKDQEAAYVPTEQCGPILSKATDF
jgi:hypothetical protein